MRSFIHRVTISLVFLVVLLGLFIVFLPTFLSTEWGKNQLEAWLNHQIPGSVEMRSIDLHWGKGQKIEGLVLRDPEGQSVLGFEKLYTDATMWQLFNKSMHLGFSRIKDFNAAIVTDQNGQSNLQKALGIGPILDPKLPPSTISLSDVQGNFYLVADKSIPLSAYLKGTTREGSLVGSFEIDLVLTGLEGANWSELKEDAQRYLSIEGSKEAKIQAKVVNFPVDFIDQLLVIKGSKHPYLRSLLGEKLDLYLEKEPDPKGLALNLSVLTPHLQGDLKGKIENDLLTLQEPANLHFDLLPESIHPFVHPRIDLQEASRLDLSLQELQIPLGFFINDQTVDHCQYAFHMHANLSPTLINIAPFKQIKIQSLNAELQSPSCEEEILLKIHGKAEERGETFEINLESTLNKPEQAENLFNQLKTHMQASLALSHFPLDLIPLDQPSPFLNSIGSHADLQLTFHQIEDNHFEGELSAQTPFMQLNQAKFKIDQEFAFASPVEVNWKIQPDSLQMILESDKWKLSQAQQARITIERLHIPLDRPEKAKIGIDAFLPALTLSHLTELGEVKLKDVQLKIEGKSLSMWQTDLSLQSELLLPDQSPSPLLNSPINWSISSLLKVNPNGKFEMPTFFAKAQGVALTADLDGQLTSDHVFIQNKPSTLHYQVTPAAFDAISKAFQLHHKFELQSPTVLNLELETIPFDLKYDWLTKLMLKGGGHIDQITLKDRSGVMFSMEGITIPFTVDARHNALIFGLEGSGFTSLEPKPNHFSMNLRVDQWLHENKIDLSRSKTEFDSQFIHLPTSLISRFLTGQDLSPLFGPSLDIELKTLIDRETQNSGYWDMNIDGGSIHAKARLFLDESITLYESKNPTAIVKWTVTPEGYEYLSRKFFRTASPMTLSEPFTMTAQISSLNIPCELDAAAIEKGQITAHLVTSDLKWKEQPELAPVKWTGKIESQALSKMIHFDLIGQTRDSFTLSIGGAVGDLFQDSGKWQEFDRMTLNLDVKAERLTPSFFQAFNLLDAKQIDKFKALWGEKIDAQAAIRLEQLTGPVTGEIQGDIGRASLKGQLAKGILTLNAPFEWSIKVTPLLGENVLKKNTPFLSSAVSSDHPIMLSIDPEGFSCPLIPFDLTKAVVNKGKIVAGKVYFLNQGELKTLLNYITPVSDNRLTIWFTPMFFQMHAGDIHLQRFDMLIANLYTLACWGDIDIKSQNLDLVLGLTAPSLNYAFGVQGLDEDYILQVPIKGRKGKIEIDKAKMIGRISALVAQLKGGNKGKLLGSLLEIAVSDHADPTPPRPTTHPFPWAKEWRYQTKGEIVDTPHQRENSQKPQKDHSAKSDKKKHNQSKDKVESFLQLLDKI
ncbi:MAG: hypothetical protein ACHQUC_05175 [Chlamydiales bacterium]